MSGYLDDERQASGSSALFAHLQEQSYHRRIPVTGRGEQQANEINEKDFQDDELSITTWDSEEEARRAQEEWEESIKQLNLAIQVMILPFFGKWLGRKWSYWGELISYFSLLYIEAKYC